MRLLSLKSGWKTYLIMAIGIASAIAQQYGVEIPGWADWLLAFLGFGTLRHATAKQTAATLAELTALYELIQKNIVIPETVAIEKSQDGLTGVVVKREPVDVRPLPPIAGV